MKRKAKNIAVGVESSRRAKASDQAEAGDQSTGPTLTDLPPSCLHVICEFLEDDGSKNAVLRTCHVLRAAVLDTYMVKLTVKFPQKHNRQGGSDDGDSDEGSGEGSEWGSAGGSEGEWEEGSEGGSEAEGCERANKRGVGKQQQLYEQHARMLLQAKSISLELVCELDDSYGNDECLQTQSVPDMLNWLAEMYQQCNGPLTSVYKLTVKGHPTPEATIPGWLSIYCQNAVHIVAKGFELTSWRYSLRHVAARVYSRLTTVELGNMDEGHMIALMEAPRLEHVTIAGLSFKTSLAQKECHWKTLRVTGEVNVSRLCHLPWKGVEHLVLGNLKEAAWFKIRLDAKAMKRAFDHLSKYSNVTLSTNRGVALRCYDVSAADAALALPLLKYAKPFQMSAGKVSGMLMVSNLKDISLGFVESVYKALPHTITKVGFLSSKSLEKDVLERLLPLMPLHIQSFTILDSYERVCWSDVQAASVHATRPIAVLVPSFNSLTEEGTIRHKRAVEGVENVLKSKWPAVQTAMKARGHQHVSVKEVEFAYC